MGMKEGKEDREGRKKERIRKEGRTEEMKEGP